MCNNIRMLVGSRKRNASRTCRFGAFLFIGLSGFLLPLPARPAEQPVSPPVSTNYQGLRTILSYQPLPRRSGTSRETNPAPVRVMPISDELRRTYHIDPFYTKTITSAGIVIVGSDKVSDWAFLEAAYTMDHVLYESPAWVREALAATKVRMAILACVEYTMDLPENNRTPRTLAEAAFQDQRSRGLGGLPDCSCAEENLLNLRGDPYDGDGSTDAGESITIHEFSHTLAGTIRKYQGLNGDFWTKLNKAFADATAPDGYLGIQNKGRKVKIYASQSAQEYWAEGAQAWFDRADRRSSGGLHTRDDVKRQDPQLAALLAEIYGDGPWRYHKTTAKKPDGTPMRTPDELAHLEGLDDLRKQFPAYNKNNSPRIMALMQETAARTAEEAGRNAVTNAPAPSTPESRPSAR